MCVRKLPYRHDRAEFGSPLTALKISNYTDYEENTIQLQYFVVAVSQRAPSNPVSVR